MSCERERLLRKYQEADFALFEVTLYLDTHPTDKKALECFDKYQKLRNKAKEAYTSKYGALQSSQVKTSNRFSWVNNPWPWEVED